jgi:hypothetical protein
VPVFPVQEEHPALPEIDVIAIVAIPDLPRFSDAVYSRA